MTKYRGRSIVIICILCESLAVALMRNRIPDPAYSSYDRVPETVVPGLLKLTNVCVDTQGDGGEFDHVGLFSINDEAPDDATSCKNGCVNQDTYTAWDKCGIFFTKHATVKSSDELVECFRENDGIDKTVEHIEEPTLLLTTHPNIGHILTDIYGTLAHVKAHPWTRTFIPAEPSCSSEHSAWSNWGCPVLSALGVFEKTSLVVPQAHSLVCFKELYLPNVAINRDFGNLTFASCDEQNVEVVRARDTLVQQFVPAELREAKSSDAASEPKRTVLMYGHVDSDHCRWLNFAEAVEAVRAALPEVKLLTFQSTANLSVQEQAASWYDADLILGPAGADEVNGIFSRNGTFHVELGCAGFKRWFNWGNVARHYAHRYLIGPDLEHTSDEDVEGDRDLSTDNEWLVRTLREKLLNRGEASLPDPDIEELPNCV